MRVLPQFILQKELKDKKNLTLITNSMEIVIELLDMSDWRVLSTGGVSRRGIVCPCGNPDEPDASVVSCRQSNYFVQRPGYAAGLTDSDELLADNKRTMLENAKERILAIDSSKLGQQLYDGRKIERYYNDRNG